MHLDLFAFWSLIILGMLALAEVSKDFRWLGIIGSVLFIILGFWVISDNLQYQAATNSVFTEVQNLTDNITSIVRNETVTPVWAVVTAPYVDVHTFIGWIFAAVGIGGLYGYMNRL